MPRSNTIEPSDSEKQLQQAMRELRERMKGEHAKTLAVHELQKFLARRPTLTRAALLKIVHAMPVDRPKRGAKAVSSTRQSKAKNKAKPHALKIGKTITRARKAKNMSRKELATESKLSVASVSAWENGKWLPGAAARAKLAKALAIPPGALANGSALGNSAAA